MNWEAIGAVGELVGALAVVMTLAYLALQIRQSNTVARADAYSRVIDGHVRHHRALNASPESIDVFGLGLADYHSLDKTQQGLFLNFTSVTPAMYRIMYWSLGKGMSATRFSPRISP